MIKKLLNKKMKYLKNQKGLTLIELLVVIVILGIIAAIAIPMVMGQQEKANKNTNAQNLSILKDAVNRYQTFNEAPPTTLADLINLESTSVLNGAIDTDIGGPFLKEVPELKEFGDDCKAGAVAENGWTYTASSGAVEAPHTSCLPE